jgi:CheY-like chemotaxis protein
MKTSPKVLVVDDDAVVGRSFDRVLSEKGYSVTTALNGQEALNKLAGNGYDVVFTDIKMPGMDGFEVAKRIKENCPWTPVVIITGYGTAANEATAEVLGVSGFVRKPLTPDLIEGITRKALLKKEAVAVPQKVTEAAVEPPPEVAEKASALNDVVRFVKTLALLVMGARELMRHRVPMKIAVFLKNVALFIAAPFVGLAYALLFPFVGLAVLAWMGARALLRTLLKQSAAQHP